MRISKGHSILQPLIFRGFVGFRKCNDSTEFKTYSSKWVHMFHPQRSFEQKIRPPKKPLKLVAWHRQSISHTLDPLTLEATDSWRLTLQVWWMQWLLVGGCKLANFQSFEAKDVLNRNLARAPFIAPYAEGNLDTPELRFWLPSLPTSSEGLKGFSSCKWFMFTCFFLNKHQIEDESHARLKKRKNDKIQ